MRLLLISPYFPPQPAAASRRVHAFATHWSRAGVDVTVLTTEKRSDQCSDPLPIEGYQVVEIPYHGPNWMERMRKRSRSDYPSQNASVGTSRKKPITSFLTGLRDQRGIFSSVRMPDLTDYWVEPAVCWLQQHGPWDVIVSSSGPYTAHRVALAGKTLHPDSRWVADFRDLWIDNHRYRGLFPYTIRERTLQKRCLDKIDLITTVSDGLAQKLSVRCHKPTEVIFNGYDPEALAVLPEAPYFPNDQHLRVVYTGAVYPPGQDPEPLLNAMKILCDQQPELAQRLRLCVAGQSSDLWRRWINAYDIASHCEIHDVVPWQDALRMQRDAHALILLDWKSPDHGVLTAKLMDYLPARPPIVAIGPAEQSPIGNILNETQRGKHLGDDPQHIASTLTEILRKSDDSMSPRNEEAIAHFSRAHQSLRMLDFIRS